MSLEDAISKLAHEIALNTAAVKENTLVLNGGKPVTDETLSDFKAKLVSEQQQHIAAAKAKQYAEIELNADLAARQFDEAAATKTEEVIQKAKKPTPVKTEETVLSGNGASPQSEPKTAADEISAVLDYKNDIMPVLTKYFTKCGRDAAAALLKKYGVAKFSEIEQSYLDDLMGDLNNGLGAV